MNDDFNTPIAIAVLFDLVTEVNRHHSPAMARQLRGLGAVLAWLEPHWQRDLVPLLADPHAHNWKSALQEWSQGRGMGLPAYDTQERSRRYGDPQRFHCRVSVAGRELGEGWGGARRDAEQQAARAALAALSSPPACAGAG